MKIIINKQIVDTENIFSISEIHDTKGTYLSFDIVFFNGNPMTIEVLNSFTDEEFAYLKSLPKGVDRNAAVDRLTKERIEKFTKTWSDLVALWSNNQTNLPRFNF